MYEEKAVILFYLCLEQSCSYNVLEYMFTCFYLILSYFILLLA